MRDYHRKSCKISRGVYVQVKGIMMDYDRVQKEYTDIMYGTQHPISGMPRGSGTGDPTEQKAIKLDYICTVIHGIGQASVLIRADIGNKVGAEFDPIKAYWSYDYFNCQHKRTKESPNGPCRRTWNNFKDRFSALIAQKLKIF